MSVMTDEKRSTSPDKTSSNKTGPGPVTDETPKGRKASVSPSWKDSLRVRAAGARGTWRRLNEEAKAEAEQNKRPGRFGFYVAAGFYRALVVVADYLLLSVVAMALIPTIGARLHASADLTTGGLSDNRTIAFWFMPMLFVVLLLTAVCFILARGLWRWSDRRIAKARQVRLGDDAGNAGNTGTSGNTGNTAPTKTNRSSNKNKRSKR